MAEEERYLDLADIIDSYTSRLHDAPARIRAYYSDEFDHPEQYQELETDPAQLVIEDAADLVQFEFNIEEQHDTIVEDGDWVHERSSYIHFAVAAELLLNAHYMRESPIEYANRLEEHNTLNIQDGKDHFLGAIRLELTGSQRKRVSLVLELLRLKRNNAAHAGFHRHGHYAVEAPIYEVLQFLFGHLSETELDVTDELATRAAEIRDRNHGLATEHIEFPV